MSQVTITTRGNRVITVSTDVPRQSTPGIGALFRVFLESVGLRRPRRRSTFVKA